MRGMNNNKESQWRGQKVTEDVDITKKPEADSFEYRAARSW